MLLTVVIIGSIFLGASAIGGILMLYQIRQANDMAVSTQAIFAADAGIEWETFCYFKGSSSGIICPPKATTLGNGASFISKTVLDRPAKKLTISADGSAGSGERKAVRALESVFTFK